MIESRFVQAEKISIQLFDNDMSREPLCDISLGELEKMIQQDLVIAHNTAATRQLLQQGDRQGADEMKRSGRAIMVGARVAGGRTMDHVVGYTGLAMCDIDGIADDSSRDRAVALLRDDPHVAMLWITHKGMGIRVLFCSSEIPADGEAYNRLWQVGNDYFEQLTGLPVDRQTRGANHLSQVAHDPEVLLRSDVVPFAIPAAPPKPVADRAWVEHDKDPLALARDFVEQHGVWYVDGHHNEFVCRMAYQLNRYGVDASEAARMLVQAGFVDGNQRVTESVVKNVYHNNGGEHASLAYLLTPAKGGHNKKTARRKSSHPLSGEDDSNATENRRVSKTEIVMQYLSTHYRCRYNTVTGIVEVSPRDGGAFVVVDDLVVNTITNNICLECSVNVTEQLVRRVLYSDTSEQYDPFADYLERLPEWDGTDHVGRLASRAQTQEPRLFAFYLCRFLVKMVRTMLGLDINQDMLILAGPQRIGKSTFVATLLPPELRDYFDIMGNIQFVDKDIRLKLSRYALMSFEEYSGTAGGGKTAELVKGLLRQNVINERRAYGVVETRYVRRCSMVATTNESHLLVDATGNETLLPFWVERIARPADSPVDYEGLYSQLYHMATDPGYDDSVPPELKAAYDEYRHQFDAVSAEQELIAALYRQPTEEDCLMGRVSLLTASEITSCINFRNRSNLSAAKVGATLSLMGYPFKSRHHKRYYQAVALDIEEINAMKQADTELIRREAQQRHASTDDMSNPQ